MGKEKGRGGKGSDGKGEGREGKRRGREEWKRREGRKRRGSSHAFCFSNLGSSAVFCGEINRPDGHGLQLIVWPCFMEMYHCIKQHNGVNMLWCHVSLLSY